MPGTLEPFSTSTRNWAPRIAPSAYLKALECVGITYTGARCLDIGCSNGALLLAATARGASRAVGAEISRAPRCFRALADGGQWGRDPRP